MAEEASLILKMTNVTVNEYKGYAWPFKPSRGGLFRHASRNITFVFPIYRDFQSKKLHLDTTKIQQSIHRYNEKYCELQHTLVCSKMGSKSISIYRLEGLDLAKETEASKAFVSLRGGYLLN
jgi:hypothetical protein